MNRHDATTDATRTDVSVDALRERLRKLRADIDRMEERVARLGDDPEHDEPVKAAMLKLVALRDAFLESDEAKTRPRDVQAWRTALSSETNRILLHQVERRLRDYRIDGRSVQEVEADVDAILRSTEQTLEQLSVRLKSLGKALKDPDDVAASARALTPRIEDLEARVDAARTRAQEMTVWMKHLSAVRSDVQRRIDQLHSATTEGCAQ